MHKFIVAKVWWLAVVVALLFEVCKSTIETQFDAKDLSVLSFSQPEELETIIPTLTSILGEVSEVEFLPANVNGPTIDYMDNTFMRVGLSPSGSAPVFHGLFGLLAPLIRGAKLNDISINLEALGVDINATNIVIQKASFYPRSNCGVIPDGNLTGDFQIPLMNITISLNYSVSFDQKEVTNGNATMNIVGMSLKLKIGNIQEVIEGHPIGRIYLEMKGVNFDYGRFDAQFSNPYTQLEWDALFDHPEITKKLLDTVLFFQLTKTFSTVDLRKIVNVSFKSGVNLLLGLPKEFKFDHTGRPEPNDRLMDLFMHIVFTTKAGEIISGNFDVNMAAPFQSLNYTTLALNTDALNKWLKAVTMDRNLNISFNQKLLDLIKFNLIRLDTSSLRAIFPFMEKQFGPNLGVFFNIYLPSDYEKYKSYFRLNSGYLNLVLRIILEAWVDTDPNTAAYYNSTLKQCWQVTPLSPCKLSVTLTLDTYITTAIQVTKDKKLTFGSPDIEVTRVDVYPQLISNEIMQEKLNNFLEIMLPHLLPNINLGLLVPNSNLSFDGLDDQRAIWGIQHLPPTEETAAE